MKRILIPFILMAFIHASIAAESIQLTRTDYYPKNDDDYFFLALPDMATINDCLFVADIFYHRVLVFSVKDGIELLKDQTGYSFFDAKGNIKNRFVLTA